MLSLAKSSIVMAIPLRLRAALKPHDYLAAVQSYVQSAFVHAGYFRHCAYAYGRGVAVKPEELLERQGSLFPGS